MQIRCGVLLAALAVCTPLFAQTPPAAPTQAGKIDLAEGDAKIIPVSGAVRAAKAGDVVNEGDTLVTGKDGEVHVTMQDTAFIAVRPATRLQILKYKAEGGEADSAVLKLVVGGFRAVTGWIGKYNRSGYRVQTPTATIGVRGTDHEPRYVPEGSSEGEPGTYDKVYVGQTSITNATGSASVAPNQAGFVPLKARERPRLLANVPRFYVPSKYEVEIAKKHAEIQQMIVQRREERRKVIREMRSDLVKSRQGAVQQLEHNKAAKDERQQTAQARREDNGDKRKAIQSENADLLQKRKVFEEKRQALQDDAKAGRLTPEELRARRKALMEDAKALQVENKDVQQKREALKDDNKAALKDRIDAAKGDHKALQEKFKEAKGKRQALDEEREATKAEISDLHKKERERYKEEMKAARQKAAAEARANAKSQ